MDSVFSSKTSQFMVSADLSMENVNRERGREMKEKTILVVAILAMVLATPMIVRVNAIKTTDVNGDGTVNVKDVYAVGKAFGSRPGYSNWNASCDINEDGAVDLKDVRLVCIDFGKTITP